MKVFNRIKQINLFTHTKLFVLIFVFLLTLKSHRTYMGSGDEPHYVLLAESLIMDFDVDVKNNYLSDWQVVITPNAHHTYIMPNGKERPVATIGLPVLGIPTYLFVRLSFAVGEALGAFQDNADKWIYIKNSFSISMMIVASFFGLFLWRFFYRLTNHQKLSWVLALIFTISPPMVCYEFLFFTDFPSAFLITYLFWRLLNRDRPGGLDGGVIGFLPWLHPRNGLVAAMFMFLFLWKSCQDLGFKNFLAQRRALSIFILIPFMSFCGIIFYNYLVWENFSLMGIYGHLNLKTNDWSYLWITVPALFFDRSFGIFIMNPLYLFFPAGLFLLYKTNRRACWYLVLLLLAYVTSISTFVYWWGGWSPGPRYLVPVVPLLILPTGVFLAEAWKHVNWRWFVKTLFGVTLAMTMLYWQKPKLMWNHAEEGVNRYLIYWFGEVGKVAQDFWPNFFIPAPTPQIMAGCYAVVILSLNYFVAARLMKTASVEHT